MASKDMWKNMILPWDPNDYRQLPRDPYYNYGYRNGNDRYAQERDNYRNHYDITDIKIVCTQVPNAGTVYYGSGTAEWVFQDSRYNSPFRFEIHDDRVRVVDSNIPSGVALRFKEYVELLEAELDDDSEGG